VDAYANTQFEWRNRYIQRILPYLPKNRSSVILDAACGQGYISIALAEMGYSVIACDLSIEGLKRARAVAKFKKLTDRILFVASDVTKLRLKKVSVGTVILLHIIEHLKQDKRVIKQLMEFCKKNGAFVIGVPLSYKYIFPLFIPMYYYSDLRVGHYRHYALEDLSRLFGNTARVLHVYYTGHVIKLIGAVFSLFRITSFEKAIEDMDERRIDSKFWASNIMAIFQKI
jgi:ubiquinone/menaquinone biosynthesis C-methylase UbiE